MRISGREYRHCRMTVPARRLFSSAAYGLLVAACQRWRTSGFAGRCSWPFLLRTTWDRQRRSGCDATRKSDEIAKLASRDDGCCQVHKRDQRPVDANGFFRLELSVSHAGTT